MKKMMNLYGEKVLVLENQNENIPFGYIGKIINITKERYNEYVQNWTSTVMTKYPESFYATYEHWIEAQLNELQEVA